MKPAALPSTPEGPPTPTHPLWQTTMPWARRTHSAIVAMTTPMVSLRLHQMRDPSDVPQLNAEEGPEYAASSSGPGSSSSWSARNDVFGVGPIPSSWAASTQPEDVMKKRVGALKYSDEVRVPNAASLTSTASFVAKTAEKCSACSLLTLVRLTSSRC